MSGFSKNPNSIHQNNLKFLADLNRLTSNRVKELKKRFSNGPKKHLSRGRYCLRPDYIPQFDEWTSFTESPPSPQPSPPPQYWTNQQSQQLRVITQQPVNHLNQQPGHYQRGNSQMPVHSQRLSVNSQQRSTQQQTAPNTSNTGANGQTPAPSEKKVDLSVANMLLSLGLTSKSSFNEKELKVLEEQGRLPKKDEQGHLSKKNGETSSVARRSQPQTNQQQRRQEGKQPAIKKPAQENNTSSISASLTKCQILLETYENIRKGRKRLILPKEEDIKILHKRNKEKEVAMKRPQKRPALKGKSKEKAVELDENVEIASVKKQARPEQFIVALKHSAKRSRENDESSKSMASKKRKTEHYSAVQTVSRTVQAEAEMNTHEVQTDPPYVVSVAVQTDSDLPSSNVSSSNSSTESALANDEVEVMKMSNEAHKRYVDLFSKATNLKRQGDHNENPSDYAEAACYYADAFYEQLIAASLGHNENVVNPAGFMSHVINRFDKDKKIQAAFWGLKALITRRYFLFEDKRVRPMLKDTIIRYNELIEKTGRLSEQTLAFKREHYNKALSDSNKVEDLVNDFTKYWEKTNMYKQLGFNLESDIRFAVDYIRNLLKEWRRDNDSKNKEIKKNAPQPKSRSNRH
ncbi:hypothetical protein RclHR1_06880013 [Rhizophagus clarus]|uniref:Uncharacterized protein n=1 Tax=Rhizophagus clarus TaxID=94130 RepID=A0A2Z6RU03_9GLOM|nr:hypothetical protein RclHR1_06880013 [Rhizophagus clarus]GES99640.1 hypothetical protein GLOIN_2v1542142 [Rhizophagus clarus]